MRGEFVERKCQQEIDPRQLRRDRIALDAVDPVRPQFQHTRRPDQVMTAAAARIEKPARTGSEPQRIVGQAGRCVVGSPDGAMPDGSQRLVQLAQRLFAIHRRQRFEKTQSPHSGFLPQPPPPVLQYNPHRFPQKTDRSYAVELNLPRRFEALQRGRVHRALEPRPQRTENSRRFPAGAAETADRRTAFVRPAGQPAPLSDRFSRRNAATASTRNRYGLSRSGSSTPRRTQLRSVAVDT